MQTEQETPEKTERTGAGMLALEEGAKRSLFGDGCSHAEDPARSHAHPSVPSVCSCWSLNSHGLAVARQLNGDHTRPACRRRRLGDDLLAQTLKSPSGDRKSERLKCSAGRLPAGRQAEHGTPAACGPRLVCMDTAMALGSPRARARANVSIPPRTDYSSRSAALPGELVRSPGAHAPPRQRCASSPRDPEAQTTLDPHSADFQTAVVFLHRVPGRPLATADHRPKDPPPTPMISGRGPQPEAKPVTPNTTCRVAETKLAQRRFVTRNIVPASMPLTSNKVRSGSAPSGLPD
jgi:hypothetical protein